MLPIKPFFCWTCPIARLDVSDLRIGRVRWFSGLFLHVAIWVDAEAAGDGLLDGQAADLPAVEHRGEGAPVGFVDVESAQALGVFGVAGGLFDEVLNLGGVVAEHTGGDAFAVGDGLHGVNQCDEVLRHVVGGEAGLGGAELVGNLGFLDGAGGLLLHEIDDVAVGELLGVLLVHLRVDVGGVGYARRRHLVEVAHEVAVGINHRDAEEGGVLLLVLVVGRVKRRPAFEDII